MAAFFTWRHDPRRTGEQLGLCVIALSIAATLIKVWRMTRGFRILSALIVLALGFTAGWGYNKLEKTETSASRAGFLSGANDQNVERTVVAAETKQTKQHPTTAQSLLLKGKRLWGRFWRRPDSNVLETHNAVLCRHSSQLCRNPLPEQKK